MLADVLIQQQRFINTGTYGLSMLTKLEQLISDISEAHSKLVLLVGASGSGKTHLLRQLGAKLSIDPLNVSLELGRRLAVTPKSKRGFSAADLLKEIASQAQTGKPPQTPLLLDNLELLFEPSLQINPLALMKQLAHSRCISAAWPGELRNGRLLYGDISHPEHREDSLDGVVVLEVLPN